MTLTITHTKVSAKADGPDSTLIRPSDWNAGHTITGQVLDQGHLAGLLLSNNGTDPTNDIDIAAGQARDGSNAKDLILASTLTKRLDAAWAVGSGNGGLDTGAIANTTYHVWLILRSDTGVVDALFSTSASSPTMPTSYDYKRYIGHIIRSGGAILLFYNSGTGNERYYALDTPVLDVNTAPASTAAVTRTLTVPVGISVQADVSLHVWGTSVTVAGVLSDLDVDDVAAAAVDNAHAISTAQAGVQTFGAAQVRVKTNASAQIRSRLSTADASANIAIRTRGWGVSL